MNKAGMGPDGLIKQRTVFPPGDMTSGVAKINFWHSPYTITAQAICPRNQTQWSDKISVDNTILKMPHGSSAVSRRKRLKRWTYTQNGSQLPLPLESRFITGWAKGKALSEKAMVAT